MRLYLMDQKRMYVILSAIPHDHAHPFRINNTHWPLAPPPNAVTQTDFLTGVPILTANTFVFGNWLRMDSYSIGFSMMQPLYRSFDIAMP